MTFRPSSDASTSDFLFYTVTTLPADLNVISKESSTRVHADSQTIHDFLKASLPSLLLTTSHSGTAATAATAATSSHTFNSSLQIGTSASGKPTHTSFAYSLLLESNNANTITISTLPPTVPPTVTNTSAPETIRPSSSAFAAPQHVDITGFFSLIPSMFGTTVVTLNVTLGIPPETFSLGSTLSSSSVFSGALGTLRTFGGNGTVGGGGGKDKPAGGLGRKKTIAKFNSAAAGALKLASGKSSGGLTRARHQRPLDHFLSLIPALHNRFARYQEVDQERFDAFEELVTNSPPPILSHEDNLVTKSLKTGGDNQDSGWRRIAGTVRESVGYWKKTENNDIWGKSVANVDAPASHVFANFFCLDSYESTLNHVKKEGKGAFRKVVMIPESHSMLQTSVVRFGVSVSNRLFSAWFAWRAEPDGSYVIAFAPLEEYADTSRVQEMNTLVGRDPLATKAICGQLRGFWLFKPLAPTVCQMTYVIQVNLGGSLPKQLLAMRTKQTLGVVQTTQEEFERNGREVDADMRSSFPQPPALGELSDEQKAIYESCRLLETEGEQEWEVMTSPSPSPFVGKPRPSHIRVRPLPPHVFAPFCPHMCLRPLFTHVCALCPRMCVRACAPFAPTCVCVCALCSHLRMCPPSLTCIT